jgi:succinate-acetate transporter protein
MSAQHATARTDGHADWESFESWQARSRIFLSPVAAPSVLGLFGFAAATFIVSAHLAGWYGNSDTPTYLAPFAATFGGIAQFAAGMWAFRARDALATAMHGMWGAFWIAYGLLYILSGIGLLSIPSGAQFLELGYWFLALAAITVFGTFAALGENLALTAVLGTLATGSAFLAIALLTGSSGWETVGAWVLLASSWLAAYTAGAMMIAASWGRTVLPLGEYSKKANIPGRQPMRPIEYSGGMPGVKVGQ